MSLGKIVLGLATATSATMGCAMYGVTDAKGTPLPGREYVWPGTALASLYVGSVISLPDHGPDKVFGGMCAVATGVVGAASYGVGYLIGSLS